MMSVGTWALGSTHVLECNTCYNAMFKTKYIGGAIIFLKQGGYEMENAMAVRVVHS